MKTSKKGIENMTDNEIVKALECCTTKGAKCSDCPAFKKVDRSNCKKYFRGAIDLINRQQTEIERLNNNISAMVVTLHNSAKATRNEAIKEFAKRLKEEWFNNRYDSPDIEFDYFIDNFVKEYEKGSEGK